jgi:plasmid stabilization system protein ParE
MTFQVFNSRRADREIEEIADYLSEHSSRAAQRFREALDRAHRQLQNFPNSGAPGSRPGMRRLIVGNYFVSYRRRGDDVEIFAVRHSRRHDARF